MVGAVPNLFPSAHPTASLVDHQVVAPFVETISAKPATERTTIPAPAIAHTAEASHRRGTTAAQMGATIRYAMPPLFRAPRNLRRILATAAEMALALLARTQPTVLLTAKVRRRPQFLHPQPLLSALLRRLLCFSPPPSVVRVEAVVEVMQNAAARIARATESASKHSLDRGNEEKWPNVFGNTSITLYLYIRIDHSK